MHINSALALVDISFTNPYRANYLNENNVLLTMLYKRDFF